MQIFNFFFTNSKLPWNKYSFKFIKITIMNIKAYMKKKVFVFFRKQKIFNFRLIKNLKQGNAINTCIFYTI